MAVLHAGNPRDRCEQLRVLQVGYVVDVIAARPRAVEAVGLRDGVEPYVHVVVAAECGRARRVGLGGQGNVAHQARLSTRRNYLVHVIDVRDRGTGHRREHERRAARVLVGVVLVIATGVPGVLDPRDFLDLGSVWQPGDVEHHRAEVHVGPALLELEALQEVVAALALHIHRAQGAGASSQLRLLDLPVVDDFGLGGILDADDEEARRCEPMADVDVRT